MGQAGGLHGCPHTSHLEDIKEASALQYPVHLDGILMVVWQSRIHGVQVFELASVLTAVAVWKMKHAAAICRKAGPMGADSSTAAQVCRLHEYFLRLVAGRMVCIPHAIEVALIHADSQVLCSIKPSKQTAGVLLT